MGQAININATIRNRFWAYVFLLAALALAICTQIYQFTAVPGFHFDEAWQGLYAHRIASEPGFWPFHAMNQYTVAVVHYGLAIIFKIFGTTFFNLRFAIGSLNILTLILLTRLIIKNNSKSSATIFILLWALMPMMVHDHRFYVEMTYWFGFCFSLCMTGYCSKNAILRNTLIPLGLFLGVFSHVLFTIVPISYSLITLLRRPLNRFEKGSCGLLALWMFYIFFGTHKISAAALALLFLGLSAIPFQFHEKLNPSKTRFLHIALFMICSPYLAFFLMLIWDGRWSYAQATGLLSTSWLPINGLISIYLLVHAWRSKSPWLVSFLIVFLVNSFFLIKPAPRFYMIPAIVLCYGLAIEIDNQKKAVRTMIVFLLVIWNSWAFQKDYIKAFQEFGGKNEGFQWLWFRDSNRDFRPFQKVFAWLKEKNCALTIREVEDDRFLRPIEFLQIDLAQQVHYEEHCSWPKNDLLFTHWPNHDLKNHELLAQEPTWGDLCLALRIPEKK